MDLTPAPIVVHDEGRRWNTQLAAGGSSLAEDDYCIDITFPKGLAESQAKTEELLNSAWLTQVSNHRYGLVVARPWMADWSARQLHISFKTSFVLWQRNWARKHHYLCLPACSRCGDMTLGACPMILGAGDQARLCGKVICKTCQVQGPKMCQSCRGFVPWHLPVGDIDGCIRPTRR